MVLEDSDQDDDCCVQPEQYLQCLDKPWSTGWYAVKFNTIDDERNRDKEGSEEEAFVRMMQTELERTAVVNEAVCDAGAEREEQDNVQYEENLSNGLQSVEAVWLLAKKCRDGAG